MYLHTYTYGGQGVNYVSMLFFFGHRRPTVSSGNEYSTFIPSKQGLSTYPSQLCVLSDHIESCLWMLEHEQRKSTLIFLTRLLLHTYTIA